MHLLMHALLHTSPFIIYLLVSLILMLESTGVPLTNNTLLLVLGAMAALGYLNIEVLMLAAFLGSISGACCAYWIGARGGRRIMLRLAAFFHVNRQNIRVMDNWFHRSGFWMVFLSRMTPFIRPFASFPAGIAHMNFKRFLFAASAGSLLWCIALPSIGWTLGPHWRIALNFMQTYTVPTILIVVLLLVLYGVIKHKVKHAIDVRYHSAPTS